MGIETMRHRLLGKNRPSECEFHLNIQPIQFDFWPKPNYRTAPTFLDQMAGTHPLPLLDHFKTKKHTTVLFVWWVLNVGSGHMIIIYNLGGS